MPAVSSQFGFLEASDDDVRFVIRGSGAKDALTIIASYRPTETSLVGVTLLTPGVPPPLSINESTFYGRLLILDGELPLNPILSCTSVIKGPRILLDVDLHSFGPLQILFPLVVSEGAPRTSPGGTLSVILCRGTNLANVGMPSVRDFFTGKLNVSGQSFLTKAQ